MEQVVIIGIDLAKHSFQLHGAWMDGSVAFRKQLSRGKLPGFLAWQPRCVVAMEACASAHHRGRGVRGAGSRCEADPADLREAVREAAAAEAICEAAQRPTMHFVAVKTAEQQARGMLFRTQTINALRGHLAQFGVVAAQGPAHVSRLALALEDPGLALPDQVREPGKLLFDRIVELNAEIGSLEKELHVCARRDEEAARLMTIPGGGPITAMALQAFAPPMESFRRGRDFAAWLGLVPRQHSTGASRGGARYPRWASAIPGVC